MDITFLTDNYTDQKKLLSEHGFSCIVDFNNFRFIFDTGQTFTMEHNAKVLNIVIEDINTIFLSHGHYDHTGGLKYLNKPSKKYKLYCSTDINSNHMKKNPDGTYAFIGLNKEDLNNDFFEFKFVKDFININESLVFTHITKYDNFDSDPNLYIKEHDSYKKDTFNDEMFLILKESDGISIITGCSHRGILNIVKTAIELTGINTIKSLIGGFHLFRSSEEEIINVANALNGYDIKYIVTGHCTGLNGLCVLKNICKDKVIPIKAGLVLTLN